MSIMTLRGITKLYYITAIKQIINNSIPTQ